MWCQRLVAPYTFERIDIPEPDPESLAERQVLLRFLAAGICGSDLPGFKGTQGKLPGDTGPCAAGIDGFPIHEIVGEVLASRHPDHAVGDRVVGWASGFDGLMDIVRSDGDEVLAMSIPWSAPEVVAEQTGGTYQYVSLSAPSVSALSGPTRAAASAWATRRSSTR